MYKLTIDWDSVDWSLTNAMLSKRLGCHAETVRAVRQKRGIPKSPIANKPSRVIDRQLKPEDQPADFKYIVCAGGELAMVDNEDFERATQFGWSASGGYPKAAVKDGGVRKMMRLHEFILGPYVGDECDHRDRNKLNNRRNNLRLSTRRQNLQNRLNFKRKSRFKGVRRAHSDLERWTAEIWVNGTPVHLGTFATQEEAAAAYNKAALEHFGEFAALNPLPEVAISDLSH